MRWYKRDPDAFAFGTIGLTLEEIGAYTLILDAMYSREGSLPDDDLLLRRILRCHHHTWKRIKASLVTKGKIWIYPPGYIGGKRVGKEIGRFKKHQRKQGNGATEYRREKNYSKSNSSLSSRKAEPRA